MTDTRALLMKISAFRQRLEAMPRLMPDPWPASSRPDHTPANSEEALDAKVKAGSKTQALLQTSLKQITSIAESTNPIPNQLTARARRLLHESKQILDVLRTLADHPLLAGPEGQPAEVDPLVTYYRDSASMLESAIRLASTFPDTPSVQLRLCEGIETILQSVRDRLTALHQAIGNRQRDDEQVNQLAHLLTSLDSGQTLDQNLFVDLAETIWNEEPSTPLRFLSASPWASQAYQGGLSFPPPVRFVACHGITVARVLTRLLRADRQLRNHAMEMILSALLMDVGMLQVPVEILQSTAPLTDAQKRQIEAHPQIGAERIRQQVPSLSPLAEIVAQHHERQDGTGYPRGLRPDQQLVMTRLLAVADIYTAMCCSRPNRPAQDPRTALTDTLLLAERGLLDRQQAHKLLTLSFYPIGAVVELADGCVGVVVANHGNKNQIQTAARPVLALLTDTEGKILPTPRHIDLAETDQGSVVRTLGTEERTHLLARHYPQWI